MIRQIKLNPETLEPDENGLMYRQILDEDGNVIVTEIDSPAPQPPASGPTIEERLAAAEEQNAAMLLALVTHDLI